MSTAGSSGSKKKKRKREPEKQPPAAAKKKRGRASKKKSAVAAEEPKLPSMTAEQFARHARTKAIRERFARLAWLLEHKVDHYLQTAED